MSTITLFVAILFALMGIIALTKPWRILELFGISVATADGRNEIRAVYGGFGIAVCLLLTATLWRESIRPGVLIAVAAALLGMAAGRIVSAVIDRTLGRYPLIFLIVEVVLAVMLLAAL
jgi:hypothetical protein